MSSRRTDLRVFQIQDALTLLELDGYTLRVTEPSPPGRVYLYAERGDEIISITNFEVEN